MGCSRSSVPESRFPIGIYDVSEARHLPRLRRLGFDSFHSSSQDPAVLSRLAHEARRQKMDMVIYPESVIPSTFSSLAAKWPVAAWYIVDEPGVKKWPERRLRRVNDEVKAWSSGRRTTFVIGEGARAKDYGGVGDILMLDWYPVPHLPLESVSDQLDAARAHLPDGKPIWAVVQAFDWRDYAQRDPRKRRTGRFPNYLEIRFMSYAAVVHGAEGIYYFTLRKPGGRTLLDVPEELQAVTRVVSELRSLQPILEKGVPSVLPFEAPERKIEAKAWRYKSRVYLIVLNRSGKAPARIPNELLDSRWRPLFERRREAKELLLQRDGSWYIRPYQVLVFESRLRLLSRSR